MFPGESRQPQFKEISKTELYNLGINIDAQQFVDNIEDLRQNPPNIIIAQAIKDIKFRQNYYPKDQEMQKRENYVMALGVYQQLRNDSRTNQTILKPGSLKFNKCYKPYIGHDLTDKTLLVWRQGGIGDLIFISPNLRYLKEKYPTCKIKFACGPQYQSMVREWSFIDEVLDLPFTSRELISADYHSLFEGVIERTRQAEKENSYRLFTQWMGLNLPDELLLPQQDPSIEKLRMCRDLLTEWDVEPGNFIICQMRASSPIRTPRPSIWKNILNNISSKGYKVVITDSPHMINETQKFIDSLDNKENIVNFCGKSEDIADSIAMTSLARIAVSVDSSLIHIAESVGTKSFGIFGPFLGEVRLSTYKNSSWIDAKKDCAPCFKHGQYPCSNSSDGYVRCFDNLNTEEVCNKIEEQYNK